MKETFAKAIMLTELPGGGKVETWYDRRSRNYVTQLKDSEGNQVGEAEYSGTRAGANLSHKEKEREAKMARIETTKERIRELKDQLPDTRDCNCGGLINYSSGECNGCDYPDPVL